jgi:hypothetical protein
MATSWFSTPWTVCSQRPPPHAGLLSRAEPPGPRPNRAASTAAPDTEVDVDAKERTKELELRCPEDGCRCSQKRKLLVTLIDFPCVLLGSGAVVQVACPNRKSRLVQIRL